MAAIRSENMNYNYSEAIIQLRVKLNISQTELAKLLGVSFSSVNRWEKGRYSPTIIAREKLKKLFKENGISLEG